MTSSASRPSALACIPGIQAFLEVQASKFTDLHDIFEQVKAVWGDPA